jgi:hypothetical protein
VNCLPIFLVPSRSFSTPLYPWNVVSQGACPNSFSFRCFHLWTHNWIHPETWGCIDKSAHVWRTIRIGKAGLLFPAHKHEGYWRPQVIPLCWLVGRCCDGKGWILPQHWSKVLCFLKNAKKLRLLKDHILIEDGKNICHHASKTEDDFFFPSL